MLLNRSTATFPGGPTDYSFLFGPLFWPDKCSVEPCCWDTVISPQHEIVASEKKIIFIELSLLQIDQPYLHANLYNRDFVLK